MGDAYVRFEGGGDAAEDEFAAEFGDYVGHAGGVGGGELDGFAGGVDGAVADGGGEGAEGVGRDAGEVGELEVGRAEFPPGGEETVGFGAADFEIGGAEVFPGEADVAIELLLMNTEDCGGAGGGGSSGDVAEGGGLAESGSEVEVFGWGGGVGFGGHGFSFCSQKPLRVERFGDGK